MIRTQYNRKHKLAFVVTMLVIFGPAVMFMPWAYERQLTNADPTRDRSFVTIKRTWIWNEFDLPTGQVHPDDYRTARPAWGAWAAQSICAALMYVSIWGLITYELRCSRWNKGWCERCGYDLRSGGQSNCPECGLVRASNYPDPQRMGAG